MFKTNKAIVVDALEHKPTFQLELVHRTGLHSGIVSRVVRGLVEAGCASQEISQCPHCCKQSLMVTLIAQPTTRMYKRKQQNAKPKPRPKKPVTPPAHDGTVFGLMAAQLGGKS